jgi:hypothetical protein
MKESLQKALATGDVGRVPVFFLSRLFRKLLMAMYMRPARWNELMSIYMEPDLTRKQMTDKRGRMQRNLAGANMSVRTFVTGLRMLRVKSIKITLDVEFHNTPTITVSDHIDVGGGNELTRH